MAAAAGINQRLHAWRIVGAIRGQTKPDVTGRIQRLADVGLDRTPSKLAMDLADVVPIIPKIENGTEELIDRVHKTGVNLDQRRQRERRRYVASSFVPRKIHEGTYKN